MNKIQIVSLQMVKEKSLEVQYGNIIRSPYDARDTICKLIGNKDRENLVTLCLDIQNNITYAEITSVGSLNSSIVHPREVFKVAILANAASIIIGHNHPSGNLQPSLEDKSITKRLFECGKLLGIELLDHLIVNSFGDYMSLKELGIL